MPTEPKTPDHPQTIDDYIDSCPVEVRPVLEEIRRVIRKAAPGTEETISYRMPTVMLEGQHLVYFAAWKHHIGIYSIPRLDEALETVLSRYRAEKGTLRFPLEEPFPYDLMGRVVAYLVRRRGGSRQ